MWQHLRRWWPAGKAVLALVILLAIGWRFYRDLQRPDLWHRPFHPGWLLASAALYLLGLGTSAFYWYRLLRGIGQRPAFPAVVRAYYIGHLGKYAPGKAWALLLRATLTHGPQVHGGYAGLTAFYEVLTTMAAGALLAVILLAALGPPVSGSFDPRALGRLVLGQTVEGAELDHVAVLLLAVLLLLAVGTPLLPPLFNRLARRLTLPFRGKDAPPLPRLGTAGLVEGLLLTGIGWLLFGVSLWSALQATAPRPLPWTVELLGRATAYLGVAYVAGFLLLVAPGGLGVREFFLTLFLTPEVARTLDVDAAEARATVILAALGLRLVWTAAEVVMAAAVFWLPVHAARPEEALP
jgi:uncharacterized membrane protein YbhN (UPF0104 family)